MWIIPKNLLTYPYVQDTVELILDFQELSEVLQQSVMSKSKPSQSKTWLRRLKTDGLIQHLSTQTLKPTHSPNFEDAWTSSLEASLANPFPVQGEKEEMKIQDTSSPIFSKGREQQGFQFSFSKTSQESSPQSSKPTDGTTQSEHRYCSMSLESWKEQVTSVRGAYSVRKKSVLPTKENEFLFLQYPSNSPQMVLTPSVVESAMNWATPNTMDSLPPRSAEATRRMASGIRKGRSAPCNLREQVDPYSTQIYKEMREKIRQNWPTPKALEVDESVKHWKIRREKPKAKKMGPSLTVATKIHAQGQTQKNWATPRARDWKGAQSAGNKERGYGDVLPDQVERGQANWPTPVTQEAGPLLKTLTNKDGTPWDGVGRAYRPSGVHTSVGLTQCIEYLERQPTLEGGEGSSTVGNHQELQSSPRQKAWATPTARDWKGAEGRAYLKQGGTDLPSQTEKNWATPIVRDYMEAGMLSQLPPRKDGASRLDTTPRQVLEEENYKGKLNPRWVEQLMGLPVGWVMPSCSTLVITERTPMNWATPISTDYKHAGITKPPSPIKASNRERHKMPFQVLEEADYKGKLNPRWVETLMGLPVGWVMPSCSTLVITERTSLDSLGTESSPTQPQKLSEHYGENWSTPRTARKALGVLDLFAGAGGFSTGFKKENCIIVAAVEFDSEIAKTYRKNHPETVLHNVDIRDLATETVRQNFTDRNISCDILIGGPPCQGFSMAGNRVRKSFEGNFDERNELFMEFFRFVNDLKPSYFIIENVEGILSYNNGEVRDEIYRLFEGIGYSIDSKVLLAADYGVPQLRKRAFFFGTNKAVNPSTLIPPPSHDASNHVSIWDAISDLPSIESGQGKDLLVKEHHVEYTDYQLKLGAHSQNVIHNHKASSHNEETINKLKLINNGKKQSDLPEHMQTKSVHSGSWGRMEKAKPAFTLTTRINTPSVGRIVHPENNRTITPREAARIQSFPDDFVFVGGITTIGKQIGNAVPPLLAERIAEQINKIDGYLKKKTKQQKPSEHYGENWSTPLTEQRGENVKTYLSRNEKLLREGKATYGPLLQTQVEAEEMGVSLDVRKESVESPWAEYQLVIDGRRIIPKTCPPKKKV